MTTRLRHRGPDGDGFWTDSEVGIALGHRRLAIIDLSDTGHQPMISHDGRLVITYNGEIYNFGDLRKELVARECRFRGHSDTEVMLAALSHFGLEIALQRFAGMFAIGLWDRRTRTLHLIRDRMGKKPLYIALCDRALLFASELKAICAFSGFQPQLDPGALDLMLRYGWIPDHRCIWKGVIKLPPGALLSVGLDELPTLDLDGLRGRIRTWWSLADVAESGARNSTNLPVAELELELDRLLRTAVRERMIADVPLGALLSGGIDSSTVVAVMQAQSSRPVRTFTIGYSDTHYDEADDAARVARHLGTDHTELRLTAEEALATVPDLPRIWDEPFGDESQIPTFLVSRLARQHVTVALSGDGGDETFGGYARHFLTARLDPLLQLPLGVRNLGASILAGLNPESWENLLRRSPLLPEWSRRVRREHLQKLASVLGATDDQELYQRLVSVNQKTPVLSHLAADATAFCSTPVPLLPDRIAHLMYRDTTEYLPGDILTKLDRASMAVSLEGRCPLLDHRVVEFAWQLPTSVKIHNGRSKWLLRRVLSRYLPESLFDRPKHGFDVPIAQWLRGPLRDWAADLLAPSRISREGFLAPESVQLLWKDHLSGQRNHACALWAVLMFETWFDTVHDGVQSYPAEDLRLVATGAAADADRLSNDRHPPVPELRPISGKIEAANGQ